MALPPPKRVELGHCTRFGGRNNYPQWSGTRPAAMEQQILTLFAAGHTDEAIAAQLTQQGYRSPHRPYVLPSTVQTIRLKHGLMQRDHQSHPRRKAGYLTIPQLAQRLGVSKYWLHD